MGMDKMLLVEEFPDTTVIRIDTVEGRCSPFCKLFLFPKSFQAGALYTGIRDTFVCWRGYDSTEC